MLQQFVHVYRFVVQRRTESDLSFEFTVNPNPEFDLVSYMSVRMFRFLVPCFKLVFFRLRCGQVFKHGSRMDGVITAVR